MTDFVCSVVFLQFDLKKFARIYVVKSFIVVLGLQFNLLIGGVGDFFFLQVAAEGFQVGAIGDTNRYILQR